MTCIREGVEAGIFGYARTYQDGDYHNVRFEEQVGSLRIEKGNTAVLITPELAKLLKEERDEQQKPPDTPEPAPDTGEQTGDDSNDGLVEPPQAKGPTHVVVIEGTAVRGCSFSEEVDSIQDRDCPNPTSRRRDSESRNHRYRQQIRRLFGKHHPRSVKQNSEHLKAAFKSD